MKPLNSLKSIKTISFGLIYRLFYYLLFVLVSFSSCTTEDVIPTSNYNITIQTIVDQTSITNNSAFITGVFSSTQDVKKFTRGICFSKNALPTIADLESHQTGGVGEYNVVYFNGVKGTTYNARAYATNIRGTTVYGNVVSFTTTTATVSKPTVFTSTLSSITSTSAISGGNVYSDGGATVTAYGICWGTTPSPTISLSTSTMDGSGLGSFTSYISNLISGKTYYVRAYATNSAGTAYGFNKVIINEPVTDIDYNVYHTTVIGTQTWMVENLKTTKYRDGTSIPLVTDTAAWRKLSTPGYCWFLNDQTTYKSTYGALYNWYTVNTKKLAPMGWHIPTVEEFTTLINYLGGDTYAGGKLKEAGTNHWLTPNAGATNEVGFTAVGSGYRDCANGSGFFNINREVLWWCSDPEDSYKDVYYKGIYYDNGNIYGTTCFKNYGFSVRCIKD